MTSTFLGKASLQVEDLGSEMQRNLSAPQEMDMFDEVLANIVEIFDKTEPNIPFRLIRIGEDIVVAPKMNHDRGGAYQAYAGSQLSFILRNFPISENFKREMSNHSVKGVILKPGESPLLTIIFGRCTQLNPNKLTILSITKKDSNIDLSISEADAGQLIDISETKSFGIAYQNHFWDLGERETLKYLNH